MKNTLKIAALSLAVTGLMACGVETETPDFFEPNTSGQGLSLDGRVGAVEGSGNYNLMTDAYADGFGTYITMIERDARGGAMMGGLFIEGIDLTELAPGTRLVSRYSETGEPDVTMETPDGEVVDLEDDVFIEGVGCSGDSEDNMDLDVPADEVVIEIDENAEGDVVVEFENELMDGEGTVEGALLLNP